MEEQEPVGEMKDFLNNPEELLEALGEGENIFSSDEAAEGLKKQAEALGMDPEKADLAQAQKVLYARKSCKHCHGKGVLRFVPSPAKPKKIKVNLDRFLERAARRRKMTKINGQWQKRSTPKSNRITTEMPGNALGEVWNTRKPELNGLKRELSEYRACRCVRVLEM